VTVLYARELRDTAIKVNAANPGYTATDLNGHSGFRAAADAASASVHLATLSPDGPPAPSTATAGTPDGPLPW
jgi:NAD(P)-dependent dehydrogenase (short-subunit alcohol dehydrogenase family)